MPKALPVPPFRHSKPHRRAGHRTVAAFDRAWHAGPLPSCNESRRTGVYAPSDMGGGAPPSADRPPLVLVIDDDEMVRIVLQQILEHAGYRVVLTDDGRAGLAAVIEHAPDLLITDIIMPEMSGLDVIRALAQTDNAPPIIAISGGTRLDDRDALRTAIELGAVAICEKPFDPDDLLTLVRTHAGDVPDTGDGDQA